MKPEADPPLTLRMAEVSRLLNVPRSTAYAWVKTGLLPASQIGMLILVRREAVEKLLRDHEVRR